MPGAGYDFELWLEFEEWRPPPEDSPVGCDWPPDPYDEFFNMLVTVQQEQGPREYALNVWTFKFVQRARAAQGQERGEIGGRYLCAPDLLVEKMERGLLEEIVSDLLDCNDGQLDSAWLREPPRDVRPGA